MPGGVARHLRDLIVHHCGLGTGRHRRPVLFATAFLHRLAYNDAVEGGMAVTVVYLDSVFFLNGVMDYLLLLCTARLAGILCGGDGMCWQRFWAGDMPRRCSCQGADF